MQLIYLYHSDLKSDLRKVTCSLDQMALGSGFLFELSLLELYYMYLFNKPFL